MHINFFLYYFIFGIILIFLTRKMNLFIDYKIEKHKRYASKSKSYFLGGLLLLPYFYYYFGLVKNEYLLIIFLSLIFLIGFLSDTKILNSVSIRFFLQAIFILIFVQSINLEIKSTKIIFIDNFLSNPYLNSFFVTFCLMILTNGGNFIDGLNGLLLKYYITLGLVILLSLDFLNFEDLIFFKYLLLILVVLLLLNLTGIIYMGDSGAYLLSFFMGYFLINLYSDNLFISPYIIIVFFWYPCFELLFSMIRRRFKNDRTYMPDTKHLHQLLHDFIKNKFRLNNEKLSHIYTSITINSYNLIIFLISVNFIYYSEICVLILIINIIVYLFTYRSLSLKVKKIKF